MLVETDTEATPEVSPATSTGTRLPPSTRLPAPQHCRPPPEITAQVCSVPALTLSLLHAWPSQPAGQTVSVDGYSHAPAEHLPGEDQLCSVLQDEQWGSGARSQTTVAHALAAP